MLKLYGYALFLIVLFSFPPLTVFAEYDNHAYDWYFKRSEQHKPAETEPEYAALLKKYGGVFRGDPDKKVIYLTFDNGYEQGYTAEILDVLKKKDVPAAFFVTGHYLNTEPQLVKRMVQEGHIVGNHTYSHPDLTEVSNKQLQ